MLRAVIASICLAALAASLIVIARTSHQRSLDRALFTAVNHCDKAAALKALAEGANAGARYDPAPDNPNLWFRLRDLFGRAKPPEPGAPSAAMLLLASGYRTSRPNAQSEILEALIAHRANLNTADASGVTPLCFATSDRRLDACVRLLVANGADVNAARAQIRESLLTREIGQRFPAETIELMLKHGADPNWRGDTGYTPLGMALNWGSPSEVVDVLLRYHADPNQIMYVHPITGRSIAPSALLAFQPLTYVERYGRSSERAKIAAMLRAAGGR